MNLHVLALSNILEMNSVRIVRCLSDLMKVDLNDNRADEPSHEERTVAQHLADIIETLVNRKRFHYEEETTLDFYDDGDDCNYTSSEEEEESDDSSHGTDDATEDKKNESHHELSNYSIDFMQQVVDFAYTEGSSRKRRRSWRTVHHRFKCLPNGGYVSRFRKYLQHHGTKRQKTQNLDEIVSNKFVQARQQYLPVHDNDIQRWALRAARDFSFDDFQASDSWLRSFKSRHNICSRKITNVITKREVANEDDIIKSKEKFKELFNHLSSKYEGSEIINTDQVGVEKELYSNRTLSFGGERKTYGIVKSKNATTHSYTVQPTIALNGQLIGPMYLCLQEIEGKMGKTVKKHLFEPSNVVITCSKSGKLTTSLVWYWRDHCLIPSIGKQALLLSDSYPGQNDPKIYEDIESKSIERIRIPQHTTDDIQPLDRFFNRQMKTLIKRFYHHVALEQLDINLHERNNIIKLVSLVHNQLSSPVFHKMIQYSWFASGYTTINPSPFRNVLQVCFPQIAFEERCEEQDCEESVFIRCAVCSKKLCFEHFFIAYHFHTNK